MRLKRSVLCLDIAGNRWYMFKSWIRGCCSVRCDSGAVRGVCEADGGVKEVIWLDTRLQWDVGVNNIWLIPGEFLVLDGWWAVGAVGFSIIRRWARVVGTTCIFFLNGLSFINGAIALSCIENDETQTKLNSKKLILSLYWTTIYERKWDDSDPHFLTAATFKAILNYFHPVIQSVIHVNIHEKKRWRM